MIAQDGLRLPAFTSCSTRLMTAGLSGPRSQKSPTKLRFDLLHGCHPQHSLEGATSYKVHTVFAVNIANDVQHQMGVIGLSSSYFLIDQIIVLPLYVCGHFHNSNRLAEHSRAALPERYAAY